MAQSTRNFRGSIPHAQFFLRLPWLKSRASVLTKNVGGS